MKIKDRIKELRRVPARELIPNPKNWRTHPKAQSDALKGMLEEVGFADAVLAREIPGDPNCLECDGGGCDDCGPRLMLVDGHLRQSMDPDQELPVLVLDLTEEESDKVLATFDPLAAMAGTDDDAMTSLLDGIETDNDALRDLLGLVRDASDPLLIHDAEMPEEHGAETAEKTKYVSCPSCDHRWPL